MPGTCGEHSAAFARQAESADAAGRDRLQPAYSVEKLGGLEALRWLGLRKERAFDLIIFLR
jgi:hypothetical protein